MAKRQQDKVRTFRSAKANPGIRASYRRAMDVVIRQMHEDVMRDVLDEYGALEPRIARDSAGPWKSPMERMTERLRILTDRWTSRFRQFSILLAKRFVGDIKRAVKNNREQALKNAGMGIRLNPSRLYNERVQALIQGNVDLIRSIPQEHLERVKVQVNNAVAQGLDRGQLARQLQHGYGVTERRAQTIARDQTNKATASIAEATDESLGVTEGIWIHVPGRKMSRPTHVAMNGKRFKLSEGLFDPDPKVRRYVKPGSEILCACRYRPVWPESWGVNTK